MAEKGEQPSEGGAGAWLINHQAVRQGSQGLGRKEGSKAVARASGPLLNSHLTPATLLEPQAIQDDLKKEAASSCLHGDIKGHMFFTLLFCAVLCSARQNVS